MTGLRTAAREGRLETEGWRVRKDGSRFWANVIIDGIYSDGQLIGFAKITRDITERRAAETRLRQSQKMEAVGQFTGGAAHDFNNLLMAILASLEILRKRLPDDARMLALLDNAMQGAKRGTTLTQRMLAFARRQELKQETVELASSLLICPSCSSVRWGPRSTSKHIFLAIQCTYGQTPINSRPRSSTWRSMDAMLCRREVR
jgi:signal transduction histidine kinase